MPNSLDSYMRSAKYDDQIAIQTSYIKYDSGELFVALPVYHPWYEKKVQTEFYSTSNTSVVVDRGGVFDVVHFSWICDRI